jgi:hypothetical protein
MGDVEIPEIGVCEDGRKKGLKSDQSRKKRPSKFRRIPQARFIFS